jgi:methanethiol S-methyltransferase
VVAFAWAGAALFAGSLVYFLFAYAVTFGETAPDSSAAAADLTFNVLLFSLFGVHHSVFARLPVRAWLARACSPRLERAIYVWAASLMLIIVCALWRPLPGVLWDVEGAAGWALRVVQMAGIWLSLRSAAIIDVFDLAGVKQAGIRDSGSGMRRATNRESSASNPESRTPNPEFRTEGPYGWLRHPIYLGWFLLVFAAPTMTMTRLAFAVISSAYVLIAIPLEERTLRATTGGAYEEYARKVRWRLLPGVF